MDFLKKYNLEIDENSINADIKQIVSAVEGSKINGNVLRNVFACIDLTSLNATDTKSKIAQMTKKVSNMHLHYPDIPRPAAICVYPSLVSTVKENLKSDNVNIASVVGCFPSSQTFIDIKTAETKAAFAAGADEADMVISIPAIYDEDYQTAFNEVKAMKEACGTGHLKVILETGQLNLKQIKIASILSMEAGADFIKTSTGKTQPVASLDAVYVMATAIKEYIQNTGRKVGLKPSGGISDSLTAMKYFTLVGHILGAEMQNPEYFRIGASSLANNIISDIAKLETGEDEPVKYF